MCFVYEVKKNAPDSSQERKEEWMKEINTWSVLKVGRKKTVVFIEDTKLFTQHVFLHFVWFIVQIFCEYFALHRL